MGVCYLQHRNVTGLFANSAKYAVQSQKSKKISEEDNEAYNVHLRNGIQRLIYSLILALYVLLLISIVTVANLLPQSDFIHRITKDVNFIHTSTIGTHFGIRKLTSCFVLTIIIYLTRNKKDILGLTILNLGFPTSRRFRKQGNFARMQIFLSFWITILNLLLIMICIPAIKNPGPTESQYLSCLYQNVRGFVPFSELSKNIPSLDRNKLNDFQSYVYENNPGLILLTETWLTKEHLDNEIFPNDTYRCFRLDRTARTHPPDPLDKTKFRKKGGGVLIAVRSDLKVEAKEISIKSKAEILSLELNFGNKEIICVTLAYRVGTLGVPNYMEIEKHLRAVAQKKKYSKHIIVGDFNFSKTSWLTEPTGQTNDGVEKLFLDLFGDLGLGQLVNQPTHQKGRILDLILTSMESVVGDISVAGQHAVCHSDHYAITFRIKAKVEKVVNKRQTLNYKKANWEGLNKALNSIKWDILIGKDEAEVAWKKFKLVLSSLVEKYIPTIVVKDNNNPPWFDEETFKLHKKKDRLRKKFKDSNAVEDYERYSDCRKEYKLLLNQKMRTYVEDESDPGLISKKFWKHLKSTSGGTRIPESVNYGTRFRNNPVGQSELFNEFFCDQFSDSSSYDIDIDYTNDCDFDIDFNFRKVRAFLKSVNPNKAAGPDGIHGRILKNCAVSLAYPLSLIFRTSYNSGMIPKDWKIANVVPVHKKGSKTSVENYRPISLTSLVMKIFEKIIRDELMIKCETKIYTNQHGFLPQKSCTTQMISFTDSIATAMNSSIRSDIVYFDFAKAFDSVNHDIILQKLKNQFKIDGTMLKFLVNYLKDREQCVIITGQKSCASSVRSGVPQGSILGPLLFVLFINDMPEVVSDGTSIALYADDTKIWRKIESWRDHEILQLDINALHKWSLDNKMKFHPQKCKVVPVAPHDKGLKDLFNRIFPLRKMFIYKLGGLELQYVNEEKDLGVIVTSRLTWDQQVDALINKASSRLGLLKRTMHFVKCPKQRRAFYLAIVRSQFEHCVQVWRPTSDCSNKKLERIQRRAVKWILSEQDHSYNDFEYLMRLRDLDLLPLKERFITSDLLLFHDIYNNVSCIKLPDYIKPLFSDEGRRLRPKINTRQPSTGNQPLTFHKLRECRNDPLSLKCNIEPKGPAFKSSFFFRTVQEWNCLPSEIKASASKSVFREKLIQHIKRETFKTIEDEID